jgi:hypothetical protein
VPFQASVCAIAVDVSPAIAKASVDVPDAAGVVTAVFLAVVSVQLEPFQV